VPFALQLQNDYYLYFKRASAGCETMPTISACRLELLVDNEAKLIGFIAAVLQISEYEIFRIAYMQWFNHPIPEKRLDSLFKEYLAAGEAPYWVHHFARKAHEKFKNGELNYKDYGITRRVCDRGTRIKGWIITISLLLMMIVYSVLIIRTSSY
jgi:hypothetical protein